MFRLTETRKAKSNTVIVLIPALIAFWYEKEAAK